MTEHLETLDCPCGPKRVTVGGISVDLHKPIATASAAPKRRKIPGLPLGWVIVGNKNGAVITQAERERELEAIKGAEYMKAKRKRARERAEGTT